MTLRDADILELNELCNALIDGTLNEAQRAALSAWLARSEEARQFYVRVTGLSASLYHYAAEMQTEAPDAAPAANPSKHRWWWRTFGVLALAACGALVIWLGPARRGGAGWVALVIWPARPRREVTPSVALKPTTPPAVVDDEEFVARLTASKDCQCRRRFGRPARRAFAQGPARRVDQRLRRDHLRFGRTGGADRPGVAARQFRMEREPHTRHA